MAAVQVGTSVRPHACLALPCTVIQNEDAFCVPPLSWLLPAADTFLPNLATRRSRGVERDGDVVRVLVHVPHHTAHSASICASCMVLVKPDPGWNRSTVIRLDPSLSPSLAFPGTERISERLWLRISGWERKMKGGVE